MVFGKPLPAFVEQVRCQNVVFSAEAAKDVTGGVLIIERQGGGRVGAQGVRKGGEFAGNAGAKLCTFVKTEGDGGEHQGEGAGGKNEQRQPGLNGRVLEGHSLSVKPVFQSRSWLVKAGAN